MKGFYHSLTFLLVAFIAIGCEGLFQPEPENKPEAIFEDLWNTFDQQYAPFEERGVDWEEQYALFRPQVEAHPTDQELFTVLSNLLAKLDDGHVRLIAPNRDVFFSNRVRRKQIDDSLFDLSVVTSNYLENGYSTGNDSSYVYGKLKDQNVGYIYFDFIGPHLSVLDDFLSEYATVDGIIIDLRHNKGGDFTYAFSSFGRFTNKRRFVFQSKTKNGTGAEDYTDWHKWYLEPRGELVDKPITVLIDRHTISAGERAVMALKTLPNTQFMGDTTNGAQSTMIGRELANGWYYSLATQKTQLYDGKSYEGIGLAPDIVFKNQMTDVHSGKDALLEEAASRVLTQ